jgi:hypothetical protein
MNKSEKLVPIIIDADNESKAVNALVKVVEALHLSQNYFHLVDLKDKLEGFKKKFKSISDRYRQIPTPRPYNSLHELRMELSFLSRDFSDELAFEVNKSKIYHEERKTEARATGMMELADNQEFQSKMKASSASALRELVGASSVYQEYISLASVSYGLYQEFHKVGDSMKLFNDALASECREVQYHDLKDAK